MLIARILAAVSLPFELGLPEPPPKRIACPLSSHAGRLTFAIYAGDHYTWRCFACNQGGDVIAYVQARDGVSCKDALKILGSRLPREERLPWPEYQARQLDRLGAAWNVKREGYVLFCDYPGCNAQRNVPTLLEWTVEEASEGRAGWFVMPPHEHDPGGALCWRHSSDRILLSAAPLCAATRTGLASPGNRTDLGDAGGAARSS